VSKTAQQLSGEFFEGYHDRTIAEDVELMRQMMAEVRREAAEGEWRRLCRFMRDCGNIPEAEDLETNPPYPTPAVTEGDRRPKLCANGCCCRCEWCSMQSGTPRLCDECLQRRRECAERHKAEQPADAAEADPGLATTCLRCDCGGAYRPINAGLYSQCRSCGKLGPSWETVLAGADMAEEQYTGVVVVNWVDGGA
jgi:hypothetical protein